MYDLWIPIISMSANLPCISGIMAPPKIIIIKNEDPWEVYFFKSYILIAKMQGHIIEQKRPPLKNENNAIFPEEKRPIVIARKPSKLNIFNVNVGLSFAKKKAIIWIAINIENNNKS